MNQFFSKIVNFIPPEIAHFLFMQIMKTEIINNSYISPILNIDLWGKKFPNPIGLAAGFDKNAEAISGLNKLGFGFLELGTVTPLAQKGNKKPRIFRIPEYKAVIQRLGFNNNGVENFIKNIKVFKKQNNSIIGINVGKNSLTKNYLSDYSKLIKSCSNFSDYIVLNISSPNTPGLREIQKKENVELFLRQVNKINNQKKPIILKISPDISDEDLENICDISIKKKYLDGMIISNTTITREVIKTKPIKDTWKIYEQGGLSGKPLFEISNEILRKTFKKTKGKIPLIGVGGVFNAEDAYEKIAYGASLVQIYTSLVYEGPYVVSKILRGLKKLLENDGFKSIKEAVGHKVK